MSDDTTIHDSGDSIHAVSPDAVASRRRAPVIVAAVAVVIERERLQLNLFKPA